MKFQVGERVKENIHGEQGVVLEIFENIYRVKLDCGRTVNFVECNLEFVAEKVDFT